jgi:hypothetical protein
VRGKGTFSGEGGLTRVVVVGAGLAGCGAAIAAKKAEDNWGEIRCLIPDWELVKAFRTGRISEEEFSSMHIRGLEE